jgi:hypothetical protein
MIDPLKCLKEEEEAQQAFANPMRGVPSLNKRLFTKLRYLAMDQPV